MFVYIENTHKVNIRFKIDEINKRLGCNALVDLANSDIQ